MHRSFWITTFKSSFLSAIIICIVIFAIIYTMSSKANPITLLIALPLTLITYVGGLSGIPLFSLKGIVYIWITMLVFSSIAYVVKFHGGL